MLSPTPTTILLALVDEWEKTGREIQRYLDRIPSHVMDDNLDLWDIQSAIQAMISDSHRVRVRAALTRETTFELDDWLLRAAGLATELDALPYPAEMNIDMSPLGKRVRMASYLNTPRKE